MRRCDDSLLGSDDDRAIAFEPWALVLLRQRKDPDHHIRHPLPGANNPHRDHPAPRAAAV